MVEPRSRRWGWVAAALAASTVLLLPLVFLVSGSLRTPGLPPPRAPQLVPDELAWSNYERAAELVGLGGATLNSLIVAAFFVPLSVLVASWAGLALVLVGARTRSVFLVLSLAALMVPLTALLVPRFALFQWLGVVDSFVPLVAPALLGASPFYVLLYFVAFRRLPTELYDACRLEGLTPLTVWRRVAMPLVRPVTVAVAVLAFVFSWGNFLDPLVYLYDRDLFTLPLALKSLAQLDPTNYPLLLAGAVIATAPVVVGFLLAQRYLFDPHRGAGWLGR
jgi:multiple sugar transport system permease protein